MANFIPDQVIDEITLKNDIVDVISSYVQLKKNGARYTGLCPFHREKTPSFSVSPDKQLFHCFGCGAGGTVIHFIMRAENLDFVEAVKFLAARANVVIPESGSTRTTDARHRLRERIFEINRETARFYYKQLSTDPFHVSEYIEKRHLSKSSIVRFGLGVTPPAPDGLYKHLVSAGFSKDEMEAAGLLLTGGGNIIDKFRGRLMFPIFDIRGNIVGFGGRALMDVQPKYLNSPQTAVFDKSQNLYAFQLAKNSKADFFLLAEGYMDVISLHQHGFDSAVASLGTAFTDRQAQLLKRYKGEVILCYDSDEAGIKATLRAIDMLTEQKVSVRVLTQTRTKDPDEYLVKYGADEFRAELLKGQHFLDFKMSLLKRRFDLSDTEGKIRFLNGAADVLKEIDNLVEREVYVKKIADEYGISEAALLGEVEKRMREKQEYTRRSAIFRERNRKVRTKAALSALDVAERQYLALLALHPTLYRTVGEGMKSAKFSNAIYSRLFEMIGQRCEAGKPVDAASLINAFSTEEAETVAEILGAAPPYDNDRAAMLQLENVIQKERVRQKLLDAARSGESVEKASELLNDYQDKLHHANDAHEK